MAQANVTEAAHAKINLTLDVLGKRPDGYHEVEMVLQQVGLHDTLEFILQERGISLTTDHGDLSTGEENLVYRAAALLKEEAGVTAGVRIHLTKRIPVAAGLGGGSADAAATLRGLNKLWNLGLSAGRLEELGARLGSDVPFCVRGGTALAKGRGEILTPLFPGINLWVVLVKPPFSVSTAKVYDTLRLEKIAQRPDNRMVMDGQRTGDLNKIISGMGNVLESVTVLLHPEIQDIKDLLLREGALASMMSGSGPTVFGIARDRLQGENITKKLQYLGYEVYFTRTWENL